MTLSPQEIKDIEKYFGSRPEDLTEESLKKKRRSLHTKYHPDNFEKFEDETVREMATDRFQTIEQLSEKLEKYIGNKSSGFAKSSGGSDFHHSNALFAFDKLKIEINTSDKDLKYHLFGSHYRWLTLGERFKIPETKKAFIIIDEDHSGRRIGYRESIRMYLTFEPEDSVEMIAKWLFGKLDGKASSCIMHGDLVNVEFEALLMAIKQKTFLKIGSPE